MTQSIKHSISIVLFSICLMLSIGAHAQNELEDAGDDPDIPNIPLDGGLTLLIGAGAVYAGNRLRQGKKDK